MDPNGKSSDKGKNPRQHFQQIPFWMTASSAFSVTILGFAGGKVAGRESGRVGEPSGLLHKDLIWTYFAGKQGWEALGSPSGMQ